MQKLILKNFDTFIWNMSENLIFNVQFVPVKIYGWKHKIQKIEKSLKKNMVDQKNYALFLSADNFQQNAPFKNFEN